MAALFAIHEGTKKKQLLRVEYIYFVFYVVNARSFDHQPIKLRNIFPSFHVSLILNSAMKPFTVRTFVGTRLLVDGYSHTMCCSRL